MYLVAFLKQRASLPFASIGLVLDCNTVVCRDVHRLVPAICCYPSDYRKFLWQRPVLCHKLVGSAVSSVARTNRVISPRAKQAHFFVLDVGVESACCSERQLCETIFGRGQKRLQVGAGRTGLIAQDAATCNSFFFFLA